MNYLTPDPSRTITQPGFTPEPTDFDHPPTDPVAWAKRWLGEAMRLPVPNPNAVYLATATLGGRPSVRAMLLRIFDERGAVIFSNRESVKGQELSANPHAALLMHWDLLERQLRVEGTVTHADEAESDAYFAQRPRESQLNAWASDQSRPIDGITTMRERQQAMHARFEGRPVPRPPHWGGYRVALERIEFWQGEGWRYHDRVRYERRSDGWQVTRLMP